MTTPDPTAAPFGPECFINRELSWLEFNLRVLEEAENVGNPLMERMKFLAIFSSNLDEFFMVRVSGIREQAFGESAPQDTPPDGISPLEQLRRIADRTQELVARQYRCLRESIAPAMVAEGFQLVRYPDLDAQQLARIDRFFNERALPILTPMAVDPAHPSPRYHNRGLYIGAQLEQEKGLGPKRLFAVVQVPQVLPRFVNVGCEIPGQHRFVLLEDLVASRLSQLFGGFTVRSWTTFRVTRDSDLELLEQESDDMLKLIEERLKARQRGQAVRIEVSARSADDSVARTIIEDEQLHDDRAMATAKSIGSRARSTSPACGSSTNSPDIRTSMILPSPRACRGACVAATTCSPRSPPTTSSSIIPTSHSIRWWNSSRARLPIRACSPSSRRSTAPRATHRSREP
jgi:polyphosphate kinase